MNIDERPQLKHQIGRYRIVASLGQGGMGTIWLAVAGGLGEFRKLLVIKELRQDLTRNHRFVEMFLDEAKLAARLNHPNVIHTLEAGQDGERYFLAMEFLDGQPLTEVMLRATQDPSISLPVRLRILCDVLAGLHHAHELREYDGTDLHIVHRDISPQNVFVRYDGQVKVVDFGIAKAADATNVTQPGVFKGKFAYAAPEQMRGQLVDRRADVFAVGVLLWELVSLQRFAKGKLTQAAIDARLAGREPRLADVAKDAEPLLCEICDCALQVDPANRFATAEQFRVALEQYLLVSGERIDAGVLAAVMQQAFAGERAAMHRMIDARLKDSDFSESMVRRLRPPSSNELSEEDPTKVGDLSELVESSRNAPLEELTRTGSESFDRALRGPNRARLGAGIALVLLFALIAYAIVREPRAAAPIATTPTAVPAVANTSTPAAPAALTPSARRAALQAVVQDPSPVAHDEANAASDERAAEQAPSAATEQRGRGAHERVAAARASSARRASTSAAADSREQEARPAATRGNEATAIEKLEPNQSSGERSRPASLAKSEQQAPELGTDLRQVPRAERRKLDMEDPFE